MWERCGASTCPLEGQVGHGSCASWPGTRPLLCGNLVGEGSTQHYNRRVLGKGVPINNNRAFIYQLVFPQYPLAITVSLHSSWQTRGVTALSRHHVTAREIGGVG